MCMNVWMCGRLDLGHSRSASGMSGWSARSHRCRPTAPCSLRCECRTCLAMHLEMIAHAIASSRQRVVYPTWSISVVPKSCRFTSVHRRTWLRSSPRQPCEPSHRCHGCHACRTKALDPLQRGIPSHRECRHDRNYATNVFRLVLNSVPMFVDATVEGNETMHRCEV